MISQEEIAANRHEEICALLARIAQALEPETAPAPSGRRVVVTIDDEVIIDVTPELLATGFDPGVIFSARGVVMKLR